MASADQQQFKLIILNNIKCNSYEVKVVVVVELWLN